MGCNWGSDIATSRLVIPANTRVTLNMGGYDIDRNLTQSNGWKSDGEVIVVKSGAVLTVNGGSKSKSHQAYLYESTSPDARPVLSTDEGALITGALITGGASTNGAGGIHVQTGATVTLNNVTIAGCRSQKGSASRVGSVLCGYGGGMY